MARILDLAPHSAIYAGRLLAEAGHDVVRVEPPGGDAIRRLPPYLGGQPNIELGAYHQFFNAGKRSFTLDAASSEGLAVFRRLAVTADAIIGPLPPALTPDTLHAEQPHLVIAVLINDDIEEICRYARSGMMALTGQPGRVPMLMGGHVLYAATGLWVGVAMASALLTQQLRGVGQILTVDVQQCIEVFNEQAMSTYATTGRRADRRGHRGAITPVSGAFQASDGWWMLSVPNTAERWYRFLEWVQDPVLAANPSYAQEDGREAAKDVILDRIEKWSMSLKMREAVETAQSQGITSTPVQTPLDLVNDPQLTHRGFLQDVAIPNVGTVAAPAGAIASLLGRPASRAPLLGEHTTALLAELGYDGPERLALFERAVV
ncbi:MAG TPA: CoA transferase [Chloroflexota bacterium]|nr:CoA transferase [Chloroflexota bacterium]